MSDKLRAFVLGFTNAFTPIDYSEMNKIGNISKRIDRKMTISRRLTRDEITAESGQSKSIRASSY